MPKGEDKLQSWQFFHFARKHLGRHRLYAIFGNKNARAVDYWCENPRFTNKPAEAFDPIKGVRDLVQEFDDHGHTDKIRALVCYLTAETTLDQKYCPSVVELRATLTEEMLADYEALARLFKAITDCDNIDLIDDLKQAAIEEVERTVAKFYEECGKP